MEKKFELKIETRKWKDGSFIDRVFVNQYGKWHVNVGRIKNRLKVLLIFSSANFCWIKNELSNLKVTVRFTGTNEHIRIMRRRGRTTVFEYSYRFDELQKGLIIVVDASDVPIKNATTDFSLAVSQYVKNAFIEGNQADVKIITADGKEIYACKFILSRSPVFNAMLNSHDTKEAQESVIEIADFNHGIIFEMIRYMYCDEVPKLKKLALDLLYAGNKYDLPGLVNITQSYLSRKITMKNFLAIISTADLLHLTTLKEAAINFVIKNRETVLKMPEWKSFKDNNLQLYAEIMEQCFAVVAEEKSKKPMDNLCLNQFYFSS